MLVFGKTLFDVQLALSISSLIALNPARTLARVGFILCYIPLQLWDAPLYFLSLRNSTFQVLTLLP